jgi:hypothetical protein
MSLRRGLNLLTQSNEEGLVEMLVQQDVSIEQHSISTMSADPRDTGGYSSEYSKDLTRYARKVLGMNGPPLKTVILKPDVKAEVLSTLMSVTVDVTIFNPVGTFIIAFHEMLITKETTLTTLITSLQEIVDRMVKNQKDCPLDQVDLNLKGPLLVSAVQIKIFNGGQFSNLPKIKGILKGTNPIEPPSRPVSSDIAVARQSAYREGELDAKEIPCAELIHWLVGPGSDEENFWEAYRIAMQIDKVKGDPQFTSSQSPHTVEKRPMIKVMTVEKVGLLSLLSGDIHSFQICKRNSTRPKTSTMEGNSWNKGKGRAVPNDRMIDNVHDAFESRYPTFGSNIHNSEINFALDFAQTLYNNEEHSPNTTTSQILSRMMENEREPLPRVAIKPTDEKKESRRVNWATYQRMGGDPRMHELFPLDDVRFKLQEYYMHKGKHEQGQHAQPTEENTDASKPEPAAEALANYCALDPNLVEMLMESKATVEQVAYRDMNELAVGFEEEDDHRFLVGDLSPLKPLRTGSPHSGLSGTANPFQAREQASPLQGYGRKVEEPIKEENLSQDHRTMGLSNIFSKLTALTVDGDTHEGPSNSGAIYTFGGNPLNVSANSFRPSNLQVIDSTVPRAHSRFFPPASTRTRSPSPVKTSFVPAIHHPVQDVNRYESFSSFNAASAEVHAQTMQQSRGYWQTQVTEGAQNWFNGSPTTQTSTQVPNYLNMSPTKTHAQMSRAFNAPAPTTFAASTPYNAVPRTFGATPASFNAASTSFNTTSNAAERSVPIATPAIYDYRVQAQGLGNVQNRNQFQGLNQGRRTPFQGQNQGQRQGPSNMQAQGQMQNQNVTASNQVTSSSTANLSGATAYYAGTPSATPNSFNIGAGTSRSWVPPNVTPAARNARLNNFLYGRTRPAQSQLRADSPAFQSGLMGQGGNGNRTTSTYMPGVYAPSTSGNIQPGIGSASAQQSFTAESEAGSDVQQPQQLETPTKAGAEKEHYMGVD